ncbi:MAG: zinc ribbon domain-containing protein [Anaerolineae bacterium]|nr:MAG: zinc ribbon domain-containing protein [Anaerolineae bacterium]
MYEYVCLDCQKEFEVLRPMSQADQPLPCESCGGKNVRRKLTVFYAHSDGRSVAGTTAPACGSCAGGTCSTCGH